MGRHQGTIRSKKRMSLVTARERAELAWPQRRGRAGDSYRKEHNLA
jgi:hypothetical protein